jgi:hypothetical protein
VRRGVLIALAALAAVLPSPAAAAGPVPSLTPRETAQLWQRLASKQRPFSLAAECITQRVVFYAANDWLRLATRLAANSSACTQYYVSIPPLSDKSQPRPDQARRIRALGPNFHALAEINLTGWTAWVAANGASWFQAGVEARRRMAAAGYDVAAGDSWALNELNTATRVGTGNARAIIREFVRGLYTGDAAGVKGVVFVVGLAQPTTELSVYQSRVQDWYEDAAFWGDMSAYVSDWGQEVYGDVRNYAVAGADAATRRARLVEYLHHQLALANAAPETAASARAFIQSTYTPIANAAWEYTSAFGYTSVAYDVMADYVAAQVDAMRSVSARLGLAWAPRNSTEMPAAQFTAETNAILDRLAAAIVDPAGGCSATGCAAVADGAAFTPLWSSFAQWRPSQLAITSAPQALPPATPQPVTVELRTNTGLPYTAGVPVSVTFATTSATGGFSTTPDAPPTSTVTVAIASGASSVTAYYRDTQVATITASAPGKVSATQAVGVAAPPDTVAPDTTITTAPQLLVRSTQATIAFASEPGARFECSLDGSPFAACTSPVRRSALAQGKHVFLVRAVDAAGNPDASAARVAWTVDTVAPRTRIKSRSPRAVWFTAGERGVRYRCSLDGRRFADCRSPYRLGKLRPGRHTLRIRATDAAGNVERRPVALTWRS